MQLTVIGNNGAVPRPGGACSCYVVEEGETRVLLDCGTGAYSKLQQVLDPFALDAVVISHIHADHFFDLVPFRYALIYALYGPRALPMPLFVPPGGTAALAGFAQSFGSPPTFFPDVFAVREYDPAEQVVIGDLELSFQPMRHYVPSFGIRAAGRSTLAFSADTAMGQEVVALARGADLFLCEATAQNSTYPQVQAGHLCAADAGRVASEAGVGGLLLTHIWHELDPQLSVQEAHETFVGKLDVAVEGRTYGIGRK